MHHQREPYCRMGVIRFSSTSPPVPWPEKDGMTQAPDENPHNITHMYASGLRLAQPSLISQKNETLGYKLERFCKTNWHVPAKYRRSVQHVVWRGNVRVYSAAKQSRATGVLTLRFMLTWLLIMSAPLIETVFAEFIRSEIIRVNFGINIDPWWRFLFLHQTQVPSSAAAVPCTALL